MFVCSAEKKWEWERDRVVEGNQWTLENISSEAAVIYIQYSFVCISNKTINI